MSYKGEMIKNEAQISLHMSTCLSDNTIIYFLKLPPLLVDGGKCEVISTSFVIFWANFKQRKTNLLNPLRVEVLGISIRDPLHKWLSTVSTDTIWKKELYSPGQVATCVSQVMY